MLTVDPITMQLESFLVANASRLVAEIRDQMILPGSAQVVLPFGSTSEDPDRIQGKLDRLIEEIRLRCKRHDFARLLVLFRKVPHQLAFDLIRLAHASDDNHESLFSAIYPEAVLFGTNCILSQSAHAASFKSPNDRYRFTPTEAELEDALRLLSMCVLHRYQLFYMNTVARRDLSEPVSLDVLLDAYNRRQRRKVSLRLTAMTSNAIIILASIHTFPADKRVWRCTDREGGEHALLMRNFMPAPCDAATLMQQYDYLDNPDFQNAFGISFKTFWRVFVGLNRVLGCRIPTLWSDSYLASVEASYLSACLEQADDYCETALGGGYPESIWQSCHQLLQREEPRSSLPQSECKAVVDFLTYRSFDGDVRFPEQPFLFYPVSDRLLFWDYIRHGALLRCLARILTRVAGSSTTQRRKGTALEDAVIAAVSAVPGVSGARPWLYREAGRDVWDIDIGFAYQGFLFLIDAKNEQKSVRYHFDAVEVSDKVVRREEFLAELDQKLSRYAANVRRAWSDCEPLRGAICLVCTVEAEFIAKADPALWLDRFECPRVCLLTELIEFLKRPDVTKIIESHRAFVPFH